MKRHLLVAAVVALAASSLPAAALAAKGAAITGVVVARESGRGTLVVASAHGVVRTLRTASHARAGTRVRASASRLADGTYRAASVRSIGAVRRTRVHGTVVKAGARRLVLSAGGSVFAIDRARTSAAVGGSRDVQPGDVVNATVSIDTQSGTLQEDGVQTVGTSSLVGLEGTIQSLDASTLVLAVDQGAITTIAIPSSLTLPSTIAVGDRVEVSTDFAGGVFTLVTILDDHAAATGASGSSQDQQGGVEAEGIVSAVDATSLTVQTEHGGAVTFTVPSGFDLTGVAVGSRVHAKGQLQSDGTMTLVDLHVQQPEHGDGVSAEGTVTALDSGSLTITTEHGQTVVFTIPAGFDLGTLAVGDRAEAKGTPNTDGSVTLVEVKQLGGSDGGGSSGGGSGGGGSSGGGSSGGGSGDGGSGGDG